MMKGAKGLFGHLVLGWRSGIFPKPRKGPRNGVARENHFFAVFFLRKTGLFPLCAVVGANGVGRRMGVGFRLARFWLRGKIGFESPWYLTPQRPILAGPSRATEIRIF